MKRYFTTTNSDGKSHDIQRGTGKETDQRITEDPSVNDLTHNIVNLKDGYQVSIQRCKKTSDCSRWDGDDITMITDTRQRAHIHKSEGNDYVRMLYKNMQKTTAI